jgi:hypothetical protein
VEDWGKERGERVGGKEHVAYKRLGLIGSIL